MEIDSIYVGFLQISLKFGLQLLDSNEKILVWLLILKIYTYISVAITNFNCLSKYFSLLCKYSEKVKSFGRFEGSWKIFLIKK